MKTIETLLNEYEKTLESKEKWKTIYQPVYDYMMPYRFSQNKMDIYNSLGEQVADKFVERIQSLLTPIGTDWIDLEAGYTFKKLDKNINEVNQTLKGVAEICNVYKDTSNFDLACTEFFYDLIAGTACLMVLEGNIENPLRFSVIPIDKFSFTQGVFGEINSVFRNFTILKEDIQSLWRDANISNLNDINETLELLEATYYDYEKSLWFYVVIDKKNKTFILKRTYQTNPFIIVRWNKCAGEIYGRGPGLKVINDIKTLNKITEYSLRALAFTIPVFTAAQEGDYDVEDFVFEPGAINIVPSNATNNPSIAQLGINQSPDIGAYRAEKIEMDIKKNMFDDTIPTYATGSMTATEINQRINELETNLANSFGRLVNEFLYPLIKRIIEILERFGYLNKDLDLKMFNGFGYKLKVNTPLCNGQKQQELQKIISALSLLKNFDNSFAYAEKIINFNDLTPYLLNKMDFPSSFIRSKEEIETLEKNQILAQMLQERENK